MGVDESDGKFVVGVGRQAIAREKLCLRVECFGISLHEMIDLSFRSLIASHRVGTRQARHELSEVVAGDESVKVAALQAES